MLKSAYRDQRTCDALEFGVQRRGVREGIKEKLKRLIGPNKRAASGADIEDTAKTLFGDEMEQWSGDLVGLDQCARVDVPFGDHAVKRGAHLGEGEAGLDLGELGFGDEQVGLGGLDAGFGDEGLALGIFDAKSRGGSGRRAPEFVQPLVERLSVLVFRLRLGEQGFLRGGLSLLGLQRTPKKRSIDHRQKVAFFDE